MDLGLVWINNLFTVYYTNIYYNEHLQVCIYFFIYNKIIFIKIINIQITQ
jgi:hypothetical protein